MSEIVYTSIMEVKQLIKQLIKQHGCKAKVEVGVDSEPGEGSGSLFPASSIWTNGC